MQSSRLKLDPYVVAVGAVGAALLARIALKPLVGNVAPYTLYEVATMAGAVYGGMYPGLLAAALGGVAASLTIPVTPGGLALYGISSIPLLIVITKAHAVSNERRLLAEERQELLNRLALAQKVGRIGTWSWDPATDTSDASAEWFEVHGLRPPNGNTSLPTFGDWARLLHPEDSTRTVKAFEAARAAQAPFDCDYRVLWPDGSVHSLYSKAAFISDGQPSRMIGVTVDVTGRKRAEDELATAMRRLEAHFENTPVMIVEYSPEFQISRWSAECERVFGWRADEVTGNELSQFRWIHDEDMPGIRVLVNEILAGRCNRNITRNRNYRKDGSIVECEWYNSAVYDSTGRLASVLCFALDVTERNEAERKLRIAEEKLRASIGASGTGVWRWDIRAGEMEWDERMYTLCGANPGSVASAADFIELVHPDDRERVISAGERARREGTDFSEDFRVLLAEGSWRWLSSKGKVQVNSCGVPVHITGGCIDITERKHLEAALRDSAARERTRAEELQAIMDAVPAAILTADTPDCRVVLGSRTAYELLGMQPGGNLSFTAAPAEQPSNYRAVKDGRELAREELPVQLCARTGQPIRDYDFEYVFADGTRRHVFGNAVPLTDDAGRPRGAIAAFIDISDLKRMEERLRQTQKLESIGVLAGGVAHDFNNLMTTVLGNASLTLPTATGLQRPNIESIITAAERASDLTRQLLAYAGKGSFVIEEIAVPALICETAELLRVSVPKSVELRLDMRDSVPVIRADRAQVQQVVMNLIINAAEAIGDGPGTIHVKAGVENVLTPRKTPFLEDLIPGEYVFLEVCDTGSGMDEKVRARIFDPFFTTKFTGRGLGLAAVAGIVRSCRGTVEVDSAPGRGTTFRVLFPAHSRVRCETPAAAAAHCFNTSATVLVADDEPEIREFMRSALSQQGYRVLTAATGTEALDILQSVPGVDLVLLDLVMPKTPGNEALTRIRERWPEVRVLMTSGWSREEAQRLCSQYPGINFLQKPYTAATLASKIGDVLRRAS